jgi:ribosomal protein L11 methyltransferase
LPSYPVLEIEGSEAELELALALLMERGCLGTEEDPGGASLRAYFAAGARLDSIGSEISRCLPGVSVRPGAPVPDRDWLSRWKASWRGFALGESAFVLPTWKEVPDVHRFVLKLDPERAFGTGDHDTTRLAATLLERFVRPGDRVLDVGAGTGILAMVAARRGAGRILALEPDAEAARAARENVARNGLSGRVGVVLGGFEAFDALDADVIVANINSPVLERALERMTARCIVLSGLLAEEVDGFARRIPPRFAVRETWCAGEWSAIVLAAREADE